MLHPATDVSNPNRVSLIGMRFLKISLLLSIVSCLYGCEGHLIGMLNPKGWVAHEQRRLFFDTLALMLIVVLPVIVMSFAFLYHYQVSHRVNDYKPNWGHSYFLESLWWGIPCVIIVVLAILTYRKTYELDPYKRIQSNEAPLIIQAIALPWKWLFIYPEHNIATINEVVIPNKKPVEFWLTTDNVPMSALFIPQLGSQVYAMSGMRTRLNLIATDIGAYQGMNTQFNGYGFSDMNFSVRVVDSVEMNQWVAQIKHFNTPLDDTHYRQLLNPSTGNAIQYFSKVKNQLFSEVIKLYMNPKEKVHPRNDQLKSYYDLHAT